MLAKPVLGSPISPYISKLAGRFIRGIASRSGHFALWRAQREYPFIRQLRSFGCRHQLAGIQKRRGPKWGVLVIVNSGGGGGVGVADSRIKHDKLGTQWVVLLDESSHAAARNKERLSSYALAIM